MTKYLLKSKLTWNKITQHPKIGTDIWQGAMKRGQGMCGTFKAFNLTVLHVLRAGMVYNYITVWYVHVPVCAHILTLHPRTNVPLSSARIWTPFHHPLFFCPQKLSLTYQLVLNTFYLLITFPFICSALTGSRFHFNWKDPGGTPQYVQ